MILAQGWVTPETLPVLITGVISVIGSVVAGTVTIITLINKNREVKDEILSAKDVVVASADQLLKSGTVRDQKLQEIHMLVNSRVLTIMRLLVATTKKTAETTGSKVDIEAYEHALLELMKAEDSNTEVLKSAETNHKDEKASAAAEAEAKLKQVIKEVNPPPK